MVQGRQLGLPTGFNHCGGMALDHHRRTHHAIASLHVFAANQGCLLPSAMQIHACQRVWRHVSLRRQRVNSFWCLLTRQYDFDRHRFNHQGFVWHDKRKAAQIRGLKRRLHLRQAPHGNHQRRITAGIAQMHPLVSLQFTALRYLRSQGRFGLQGQMGQGGL